MEKIPIFKLTFDEDYRKRFHEGCEQIFNEGYLTNHTMVRKAEALFKELNHSQYVVGVSSCTSALEIALKAIDVRGRKLYFPLIPSSPLTLPLKMPVVFRSSQISSPGFILSVLKN